MKVRVSIENEFRIQGEEGPLSPFTTLSRVSLMQHEFRFDGETVEVTVAKQGDNWVLSGNSASILRDGRIKVEMSDGTIHLPIVPR